METIMHIKVLEVVRLKHFKCLHHSIFTAQGAGTKVPTMSIRRECTRVRSQLINIVSFCLAFDKKLPPK